MAQNFPVSDRHQNTNTGSSEKTKYEHQKIFS